MREPEPEPEQFCGDFEAWKDHAYRVIVERDKLGRELAEAQKRIKAYKTQAQSFHEEYRRKCDVETKELRAELEAAYASIDANWVTHRQLVDARKRAEELERQRDEARAALAQARAEWRGR